MSASNSQSSPPEASTLHTSPSPPPGPEAKALVFDGKTWDQDSRPLFDLLRDCEGKDCIIFARTKDFKHDPKSVAFKNLDDSQKSKLSESEAAQQRELVEWFPYTPAMFWTRTCVDHNGFFGIHTSSENAPTSGKTTNPSPKPSPASSSANQTGTSSTNHSGAGHQHTVSTHFRLIVKILKESQGSQQQDPTSSAPGKKEKEYKWHEMGFMSFSSNSRSTILCFDVPDSVITGLEDTLTSAEQYGGPFGLHVPLLEELVKLYDGSVWGMAKKVREIEERRLAESEKQDDPTHSSPSTQSSSSTQSSLPNDPAKLKDNARTAEDFGYLFEIARHMAHSVETTQIATEVVERIKIACEVLCPPPSDQVLVLRTQKLKFLHSMLRGLSARSVSNEKRLTSEQVLLSNMISQRDSQVNKSISIVSSDIALATKADGAAMKTIALVTLTFLPATFVTALLGMNFFSVDSSSTGGHLKTSKDLWIYFVVAVPLTTIVLCFWWWWQDKEETKAKNKNNMDMDQGGKLSV